MRSFLFSLFDIFFDTFGGDSSGGIRDFFGFLIGEFFLIGFLGFLDGFGV
jgi:hypothetical protein